MKIRYMNANCYGMGGIVRTVINQANAMAHLGHDVEIVSVVRTRDRPHFPVDPKVRMVTLVDSRTGAKPDTMAMRLRRRVRGGVVPPEEPAAALFSERVERSVRDYMAGLRGGVLVTTRLGLNLLAARFAPESVVRIVQEHFSLAHRGEAGRRHVVDNYGRFDAVAVLTDGDRLDYQKALPSTRVVRIPNAIHRGDGRLCDPDAKVVLAAGRLTRQKGFDLLLAAFNRVVREHPDWRLHIYGKGRKERSLRKWIDRMGLDRHVELKGVTRELDSRMADASIFALSSRFEGLPMVLIEAMSHGLPVVSFDCPTGPADIITDEVDGLLVPPQDIDAFADALKQLIAGREFRLHLGEVAAKTATAYGPDAVTPMWEGLFIDLLERKQGTPNVGTVT